MSKLLDLKSSETLETNIQKTEQLLDQFEDTKEQDFKNFEQAIEEELDLRYNFKRLFQLKPNEELIELTQRIEEDEENLLKLEETLKQFSQQTKTLEEIFDNFGTRIEKFEGKMTNIHSKTTALMDHHIDISSTSYVFKYIEKMLSVADKVRPVIESEITNNLDAYLASMQELDEALIFFSRINNFKSYNSIKKELDELIEHSLQNCEKLFKTRLERFQAAKEPDPEKSIEFIERNLELFPIDIINGFIRLVEKFESSNKITYRHSYIKSRQTCLKNSFSKLIKSIKIQKKEIRKGKIIIDATRQYRFYMDALIEYLKKEKKIIEQIIPKRHQPNVFKEIAEWSVLKLAKLGDIICSSKRNSIDSKIQLIEFYDHFSNIENSYLQLFTISQQKCDLIINILELKKNVKRATISMFEDFYKDILDQQSKKEISANGTVHEVISNSLNFLRKIFVYEITIENLFTIKTTKDDPLPIWITTNRKRKKLGSKNKLNQSNNNDSFLQNDNNDEILKESQYLTLNNKTSNNNNDNKSLNNSQIHSEYSETSVSNTNNETQDTINEIPNISKFVNSVLDALQDTLQTKTKNHKDEILTNLFLLNNYHHILKSFQTSPLGKCVLLKRIKMYDNLIQLYFEDYVGSITKKLTPFLINVQNSKMIKNDKKPKKIKKAEKNKIKKKIKGFNAEMKKQFDTQKHFSVPDIDLRNRLISQLVQELQPIYELFLKILEDLNLREELNPYIKYSSTTVEKMINGFFMEDDWI
ncbi:exocyst complex component [Anaeramoeba flamelloides]|uniref:Exocyst subunit Exo70 family protein n=1 Tax=Anaeramoeba flamelloides TaxID=1746091 RepID=A0AAV7YVK3_9EUKA|nr:exocyst complex component [Anaeramoeba flamelloides]